MRTTLAARVGSNQYQSQIRPAAVIVPPAPYLMALAAGATQRSATTDPRPLQLAVTSTDPTHNREVHDILGIVPGIEIVDRPQAENVASRKDVTVEDNARIKATSMMMAAGIPALADDAGIEVDALGGESADLGGSEWDGRTQVQHLLQRLACHGAITPRQRQAQFRAVAVVVFPDGREVAANGTVRGCIAASPRGSNGSGYDSVFIPRDGDGRTLAEMTDDEKSRLSHRGRALQQLLRALNTV